jgi:hypothetical protein
MKRVIFIIIVLFVNTMVPDVSSAHPTLAQSVAVPPGGHLLHTGLIQLNTQTGKMWYCKPFGKSCEAFKGLPDGNPNGFIGVFKLTEVKAASRGGSTGYVVYRYSSWDGSAYVCDIFFNRCESVDGWEEGKPQQQINVYQAVANSGRQLLYAGLIKLNTQTGEMWHCTPFQNTCLAFEGLPYGNLFKLTEVNKANYDSGPITEVVYRYSGETGLAYICTLQFRRCKPIPSVPFATTGSSLPPPNPPVLTIKPAAAPSLNEEKR